MVIIQVRGLRLLYYYLTATFKVTKINYVYLAGSNSINPTNDQLAPRTRERGKARDKPKAMQYSRRSSTELKSNSRAIPLSLKGNL